MKKNTNFYFYLLARLISFTGTAMQSVVLPLYILDVTGSGTLMGVFSALTLLPLFFSAPFSGIIGDSKNRKFVMIYMDMGRFVCTLILALLAVMGKISIPFVFAFQVLISTMDSFFNSSSGAIMPELVSSDTYIESCSKRGTVDGFTNLVGPVLGGILYGFLGIKIIFCINSISFMLSALILVCMKYTPAIRNAESSKSASKTFSFKSFKKDNFEALRFIKNNAGILQLTAFALITNFLMGPLFDVLMPFALKKKIGFSSQQFGALLGILTLGMIISNILISVYFKKWGTRKLMRVAFFVTAFIYLSIAVLLYPQVVHFMGGATYYLFACFAVTFMMLGFFNALSNTPISTNIQKLVPNEMRSRYNAIAGMFSMGAMPVGSFIYGILLDHLPYYYIAIFAALIIAISIAIFLTKACDEVFEVKVKDKDKDKDKAVSA